VLGQQVPGARDEKRMADVVTLPWKDVVDEVVEVSRKDSFIGMRRLWSAVEPQPGPTSGLAFEGLMHHLKKMDEKELESLSGKCGAFICPDDGRFYSERTTGELDTGQGTA
jgi:cysteine synthase